LPLFSQNMQKWLPSTKSMSTRSRRSSRRSGVSFSITMPAATGWVQAACARPLTRTVQTRQEPEGSSPFMKQSRGT
jgi:hypothetical protein